MIWTQLKNLRESKNLQQKQLAKILNVKESTLSSWETGQNKPPIDMLIAISNYFNVTLEQLLGVDKSSMIVITKDEYDTLMKAKDVLNKIDKRNKSVAINIHDNNNIIIGGSNNKNIKL